MSYTTDASRWRALTIRDANANGHFIYTVKSTKIYCRPNCPGRLARRANVGFYSTAKEAQEAGFRACKRCKPDVEVEEPQYRAVVKACSLIEEALAKSDRRGIRLGDLAKSVGLTPRYFHKIFKERMGLTPREYAQVKVMDGSGSTMTLAPTVVDTDDQFFDWGAFDLEDLVDFGVDSGSGLDKDFMAEDVQSAAAYFGSESNTCTPFPAWNQGQPGGTDLENCFMDDSMGSRLGATLAPITME